MVILCLITSHIYTTKCTTVGPREDGTSSAEGEFHKVAFLSLSTLSLFGSLWCSTCNPLFCPGIYTKGTAAATVSDTSTPTWQCVLASCWPWRLCCSLPNGWTTGTLMVELFSEDYAITHLDIAVTGSRVNQNLTWPCPDRLAPCLLSGYSF